MENILENMMKNGLRDLMEASSKELFQNDEDYQQDVRDLIQFEKQFKTLEISQSARYFINDYIACFESHLAKSSELFYMAGVKATISLLTYLQLIKLPEVSNKDHD